MRVQGEALLDNETYSDATVGTKYLGCWWNRMECRNKCKMSMGI